MRLQPETGKTEAMLSSVFFLWQTEPALIRKIASDPGCSAQIFKGGEEIFSPSRFTKSLGAVTAGSVRVYKHSEGKRVLLNTISPGGIFGAAGLFGGDEPYVTTLIAKGSTSVLFLTETLCNEIFRSSSAAAMAYISFLTDRIRFLNGRIDAYTAGSAEARLAGWLLQNESKPFCASRLSSLLAIGRASLYRAADSFVSRGLITRNGKIVMVSDREALGKIRDS